MPYDDNMSSYAALNIYVTLLIYYKQNNLTGT